MGHIVQSLGAQPRCCLRRAGWLVLIMLPGGLEWVPQDHALIVVSGQGPWLSSASCTPSAWLRSEGIRTGREGLACSLHNCWGPHALPGCHRTLVLQGFMLGSPGFPLWVSSSSHVAFTFKSTKCVGHYASEGDSTFTGLCVRSYLGDAPLPHLGASP